MTSSIDYALMASNAYAVKVTVHSKENAIPIPNGWVKLGNDGRNDLTGFTARAYKNTTTGEIVIAYTGTTFEGNTLDKTKDWLLANLPAGTGAVAAPQVVDAARFYLDILNANPSAQISFTGHSLGGGLASLMAVYFDRPATVFDEAPFEKSADSLLVVEQLKATLQLAGYTLPAAFANYIALDPLTGAIIPSPTRELRDDKVTHYYVRDEILSLVQTTAGQALLAGIGLLNPALMALALNVHGIAGKTYFLEGNATSGHDWGWPLLDGNPVDMHSVALLDAFLMSPTFLQASQNTPELLQALFASDLNIPLAANDYNLLSLLVRRQVAGEKPLEAVAADLAQLRGELAGEAFKFTLTDLALRLHYAQGVDREVSNASGVFQSAFTPLSGGIQIIRDAAHSEWTTTGFTRLEDALRSQYAEMTLKSLAGVERFSLANTTGMIATTPNDTRVDLMVGGTGADVLLGGGGDDLLFGRAGNDWLDGGQGNDILNGGLGQDVYCIRAGDGFDKIIDPDGGWLYINDGLHDLNAAGIFIRQGTSNTWTRTLPDNSILTLTHNSPWKLVLEDGSSIQLGETQDDFHSGDFGLHLLEEVAAPQTTLAIAGDLAPLDTDPVAAGVQIGHDALDNVKVGAAPEPNRADVLYDSAGDDLLRGLGGDDILYAWRGGSDRLEGGAGNDTLDAGDGDDFLMGNAGQDLLWGMAGDDVLHGGDEQALDTALLAGETQAGSGHKGDLLGGGDGNDSLVGNVGDDSINGRAGNDTLFGGNGKDELQGGLGDESFRYGQSGGLGRGRAYNFRQIERMKRVA